MSLHAYRRALELAEADEPFDGLVMAAVMRADTVNLERLELAFPALVEESRRRYNAAGGILPGEPEYAATQAARAAAGLGPTS